MGCFALRRFYSKYYTPKNRFYIRIFIVGFFIIFNIYSIIDNRDYIHNVVAMSVTTFVIILCMLVVLMVGYPKEHGKKKNDAEKVNENANRTTTDSNEDYLLGYNNSDEIASLRTINSSDEGASAQGASSVNITTSSAITEDRDGEAPDHTSFSGFGHHFIRENCRIVVVLSLFGIICSLSAAAYYIQRAVSNGEPFSMSTLQHTFYMCFILYMVCGKWFVIIILLMRRLVKAHKKDPTQFTVLMEAPIQQIYQMNTGNPELRFSLRDIPSTSGAVLQEISEGDTVTADALLYVKASDDVVMKWLRITAPVCGFALYTLQSKAREKVGARALAANSVFEPVNWLNGHVQVIAPVVVMGIPTAPPQQWPSTHF